jgi:hypothetical protein
VDYEVVVFQHRFPSLAEDITGVAPSTEAIGQLPRQPRVRPLPGHLFHQ